MDYGRLKGKAAAYVNSCKIFAEGVPQRNNNRRQLWNAGNKKGNLTTCLATYCSHLSGQSVTICVRACEMIESERSPPEEGAQYRDATMIIEFCFRSSGWDAEKMDCMARLVSVECKGDHQMLMKRMEAVLHMLPQSCTFYLMGYALCHRRLGFWISVVGLDGSSAFLRMAILAESSNCLFSEAERESSPCSFSE